MSKHFCPLSLLKNNFRDPTSAWVIASLRHEPFIWLAMQDIEFTSRAIEFLGKDPLGWTPASLALLSLGLPGRMESFAQAPLSSLDKELRKQVSKNFEDLTQGKSIYERKTDEINLQPQWFSQHALPQAGLIALALRERLRLIGSWAGFQDDIEGLPDFSVYTWFAPITILLGLIPDPFALLLEMVSPTSSFDMNVLAIHGLLSNPYPPEKRLEYLTKLCEAAPAQKHQVLLNILAHTSPELGKELANWLVIQPFHHADNFFNNPEMDLISDLAKLTHQAELFRNAGLYGQSLRLLDNALKISSNLHHDYSARWYVTADQALRKNGDEFLLNHLEDLSSWRQFTPTDGQEIESMDLLPIDIIQIKSQIRSGNVAIVTQWLSKLDEHEVKDHVEPASQIPYDIQIELIRYLIRTGDFERAAEVRYKLQALLEALKPSEPVESWFEDLYGFDSLTRLETLIEIAEIESVLGNTQNAIEIHHKILNERPNDFAILVALSNAYRSLGQLEETLHVLELTTLLKPNDLNIRRAYAQCLENNKDFEGAFVEWSYILEQSLKDGLTEHLLTKDMLDVASSAILATQPEMAIGLCQKILEADISNWRAHMLLGKANTVLEKTEEGLASLQIATQLAPEQPVALVRNCQDLSGSGTIPTSPQYPSSRNPSSSRFGRNLP
jgi:tetratricopeptide (TPR) repeat protein